jgi:hypothetical protein
LGGDDDGVDGSNDEEDMTTYKKRKKNQPKTAREQRKHRDEEGREGKAKPFPPPRQSRTRRQEEPGIGSSPFQLKWIISILYKMRNNIVNLVI